MVILHVNPLIKGQYNFFYHTYSFKNILIKKLILGEKENSSKNNNLYNDNTTWHELYKFINNNNNAYYVTKLLKTSGRQDCG